MDSHVTDSQFIVQVLNNLTNDYKLQMVLMEKYIGKEGKYVKHWWTITRTKLKTWEAVIVSRNNQWYWFEGGERPVHG
jgi:hypothetical protein